jgi:lipid-binding SYLF domain-containing protein
VSGEASVAAGPVGRTAKAGTDWKADSQWLSYSRSKGLFAGLSLGGSKIKLDDDVNRAVYGQAVNPRDVLMGKLRPEGDAGAVAVFPQTLAKYGRPKPD